jgi:predicted amidohydrolase
MKIAVVQPPTFIGDLEERNGKAALAWLDKAAAQGADLVVFPEGYPGPANPANRFDAFSALAERARRHRLHVVGSLIVPVKGGHALELRLIDDSGAIAGTYRRTTPHGPYIYHDIPAWGFDYVADDAPPQVIETRLGRIGMLVCSELFVPELSRVLTLQGADLIVYPAGGAINELLPAWRTLVWSRAIENLTFTAACQNLYGSEEGVATIASPEAVLKSATGEAMLVADLDFERLAFLRAENERIEFPKRYATIPGLGRWRRPELYRTLVDQP